MSETVVWKEITLSEQGLEDRDWQSILVITRDGQPVIKLSEGEPEDANLSRDFNDCYNILGLVKEAYEAGKRGEDWEFHAEEVDSY